MKLHGGIERSVTGPTICAEERTGQGMKEQVMKLTSAQVERTLTQVEAQAIPENHPMVRQLNQVFGDHTFFLDSNGLNIVEPAAEASQGTFLAARVVNIANWSDANLTSLAPHEPVPTDAIVELGSQH